MVIDDLGHQNSEMGMLALLPGSEFWLRSE